MQDLISKQKWQQGREKRVRQFLKTTKFFAVDGSVMLSEESIKALGDLLDAEVKEQLEYACDHCDRHEAGDECYEHVMENPPDMGI